MLDDKGVAAPYRNWNERIAEECYARNLMAPILGPDGRPRRYVNNLEWISFNFGPTVMDWLERYRYDIYSAIIEADSRSAELRGGHGNALAQAYNHTILPLSNARDRRTQILWGIRDFEHRYGRQPEGMWLPETAVDLDSIQILSDQGIRFVVLSPYQAYAVREADGEWSDATDGRVDTRVPYLVEGSAGGTISVFFYDGPLSQEIAFNGILENGHAFADRLIQALGDDAIGPRLAHVATDGETYGHHHLFGEMALAVAIEDLEANPAVRMTNYGEFLDLRPPTQTARIVEGSSWSCSHGVERWRSDCGCSTGAHPDWDQTWRAPLRAALDWLRDQLAPAFEDLGGTVLNDPWKARDEYIEVLLGEPELDFIARHLAPTAAATAGREALGHLAIQHRLMLMYTSCGWFFDDVAGLETILVLRQAASAIHEAREATGRDLESGFLDRLVEARSNVDGRTARDVYLAEVTPIRSVSRSGA